MKPHEVTGRLDPLLVWFARRGCKIYKKFRRRSTWIFMVRRWTYWTRYYTRWIRKYLFNQRICKRPSHSDRKISNRCLYNRKLQANGETHFRDETIGLILRQSFYQIPSGLDFLTIVCSNSRLFRWKGVTAFARRMMFRFGWLWLVRSSVF